DRRERRQQPGLLLRGHRMETRMKTTKLIQKILPVTVAVFFATGLSGCFQLFSKVTNAPLAIEDGGAPAPGATTTPTFSSSVANADNIVARVQNALTLPTGSASLVSPATGNFKTALAQQSSNFSTTPNPLLASGAGSIPLLAYA